MDYEHFDPPRQDLGPCSLCLCVGVNVGVGMGVDVDTCPDKGNNENDNDNDSSRSNNKPGIRMIMYEKNRFGEIDKIRVCDKCVDRVLSEKIDR